MAINKFNEKIVSPEESDHSQNKVSTAPKDLIDYGLEGLLDFEMDPYFGVSPLTYLERGKIAQSIKSCLRPPNEQTSPPFTINVRLSKNGMVLADTITLSEVSSSSFDQIDADDLRRARRAIIRCSGNLQKVLPVEKFPYWESIDFSFD